MPVFRQELMGIMIPEPKRSLHRKIALLCWLNFYVSIERHDRTFDHVMAGGSPTFALPVSHEAILICTRHALQIERRAQLEMLRFGCTKTESRAARQMASQLEFEEQVALFKALSLELDGKKPGSET